MKKGKVFIVGAGPGDIGLLTIKGLKALKKAEVVVYDFHLNAQMLNYIDHKAEFVYAGKRGGHHEMTQDEINNALIHYANEGKMVCRLKGGDPFVFGRGGEEAMALAQAGIDFEIIPGITSAIAAPAYAGIPVTHRMYSSSFAVVTGNEDITKPSSTIDWKHFARGFDTLIFLMGIKNIASITQKLIENGRDPSTPAAVIRWGSRPDQRTVVSTLQDIAGIIKQDDIRPPAVMIVGNVVNVRQHLKWYEKKPLFGHRILITREYTEDYEPLEELGGEIFEFPTIKTIEPDDYSELDSCIERIEDYNWLVFSSAKGVEFFFKRLIDINKDVRDLKGIKICAVGKRTAETIRSWGIKVDMTPDEFNSEGLIAKFNQQCGSLQSLRILLPRALEARDVFPDMIRKNGGVIDTPVTYKTIKPERHGKRLQRFLKEGRITIATFTSASTFKNFLDIMGEGAVDFLNGVTIASIGPITTQAILKTGLKVSIQPKEATISAMVDAIVNWVTGNLNTTES
ncbi:MAG: uroporphyrinogen-III C-methyltransferase [Thermodesulfovibrionales bacterium]|nr:uroporphyrinogen-III C-methyltransferase [Thermodesulfovibrionales bacterium]